MRQRNPLAIQELLDHSIGFLASSMHDLLACSLVSRSWLHPAQSIVFRSPMKHIHDMASSSTSGRTRERWLQFYRAIILSPHLACLVRELYLGTIQMDRRTIESISRLPFTHLESLWLALPKELETPGSLKALVAQDTLRHLKLYRCEDIVELLQHRSAPIRHLKLVYQGDSDLRTFRWIENTSRIHVVVLELDGDYRLELASLLKPFDMSKVKAFRIEPDNRVTISWKSMPENAIEMLDIFIDDGLTEFLDFSKFPNLRYLRLEFGYGIPDMSLPALRSIAPSQKIQTLVISMCDYPLDMSLFPDLDSILASLPVSSVEIEQTGIFDPNASRFYPNLVERKLVGSFGSCVRCRWLTLLVSPLVQFSSPVL
ncbi:hypothetical protein R3P38DRAFT_2812320 [Favolaschia claudopus]|uniref:F-box domain-containing protein n=1 Tax=Favolaschia claudopus TaxID=2862362 RepID=A0AAV9Z763_9AGAR